MSYFKLNKSENNWIFYIGRHYFTFVYKSKDKSIRTVCKIIEIADNLNSKDLQQIIDYLRACQRDKNHIINE